MGSLAVFVGAASLTACSVAGSSDSQNAPLSTQGKGNADDHKDERPVISPAKSQSAEPVALTETDRIMLDQAEKACKRDDFKSFFEAALRSKPVRLAYFTSPIETVAGMQPVDRYNFPIQILDYNYVTSDSAGMASGEREYVQLEFNQAQDERYRVDWVRVDFGKNGNDEGETPEDDKTYGPQGYLIFKPTTECWTLVEDGETHMSSVDLGVGD